MSVVGYLYPPSDSFIYKIQMQGWGFTERLSSSNNISGDFIRQYYYTDMF